MIPLADQDQLRQFFATGLTGPVKIEHFSQRPLSIFVAGREECPFCPHMRQMLEELNALSPRISLRVQEVSEARAAAEKLGVDRVPATVVRGQLNRPLTFFGFASGALFPALIDVIIDASRGRPDLDGRVRRRLQRIHDDLRLRLFVAPDCPYSPPMLRMLHQFALENHHLKLSVIEAQEFPALVGRQGVPATPFTIIGDRVRLTGLLTPEDLLDRIIKVSEGQALAAGESLAGSVGRQLTPLRQAQEPAPARGGLIIPGR